MLNFISKIELNKIISNEIELWHFDQDKHIIKYTMFNIGG